MSSNYARYSGLGGGGSGVTSLNGETGAVTLVAGSGVTITPVGQNITIAATGSLFSIGALDSQAANANGLALVSNVLSTQSADATHPGMVNNTSQTFGGTKTFTQIIDPLLVGSTSSGGTLTLESTTHATKGKILLGIAGTSAYDEVNDRLGIGTASPSRTLEVNGPASSYIALSVGGSPQTLFGTDAVGALVLFDLVQSQYGMIFKSNVGWGLGKFAPTPTAYLTLQAGTASASTAPLKILPGTNMSSAESGAIENDGSHLYYTSSTPTRFQLATTADIPSAITALTGDVSATGPGSVAATLATVNTNVGSFGSSTAIPSFTVTGKGLITAASTNVVIAPAGTLTGTTLASNVVTSSLTTVGTIGAGVWNGTAVAISFGGTGQTTKSAAFDALSPMSAGGDLIYGGASGTGTRLANGSANQVLQSNGTTLAPTWTTNIAGNAANVTGTVAIGNGGTGQVTKAAAFDALSPMSASGDIIYGGTSGTGTKLSKGSDGQVLTLASGLPSWAGGAANLAVTTQSSGPYAILTTDNVVLVNPSGAFTVTLPTAVGVTGKQYFIKKIANDASNIVTIATTSAQTIDGYSSVNVSTYEESWSLVSDGSNWQVLSHKTLTPWTTYSPSTQGFGTISANTFQWRRVGDTIQVQGRFTCGTVAGSEARVNLPTGATISAAATWKVGEWARDANVTYTSGSTLAVNAATYINFGLSNAGGTAIGTGQLSAQLGNAFASNSNVIAFSAHAPISGWYE